MIDLKIMKLLRLRAEKAENQVKVLQELTDRQIARTGKLTGQVAALLRQVKERVAEIDRLQEQVVVLKSKISKFIYGEENPDWVDPEQTKITELQEQVKELKIKLDQMPPNSGWHPYRTRPVG